MKRFLSFAIILILSITTFKISAQNMPLNNEKSTDLQLVNHGKRARTPSRYSIHCIYSPTYIYFELPSHINQLEISIENETETIWIGQISAIQPMINISELDGSYIINCVTDQNQVFTGILYF